MELLEADLAWHVECLKLARAMPSSKLRDGKVHDLETEISRLRGEARALRPIPQRLQAALARVEHLSNQANTAKDLVAECSLALGAAKKAFGVVQADLAAAEIELQEVQTAACPAVDEAMAVDAAAGHAALAELSAYLATCRAEDPNVRAILAKFGPSLGIDTAPWAGVIPPPFPGQAREQPERSAELAPSPDENAVAAALAASVRRSGAGGKAGTRSRSGTRSPTPASRRDGSAKKVGGTTSGAGASCDASSGLRLLQATLGLTGAGVPVPDEDDV